MAFVNNGPLTNGIRGKVGDVVFQMVNGIQIVRAMPPSIQDPNTPLQQIQRAAFAQAVEEWRELDVEERALWDFQASLRGNKTTHARARRVDGTPKPHNGTFFNGHNSAVVQKSREADYRRKHGDDSPTPIGLQSPPPYAKTKNLAPAHGQVLLVVGSLGKDWNPFPLVDYDGLWWYYTEPKERTADSLARAWVQPPYPIHRQRITIDDVAVPDVWTDIPGVFDHDGVMWAWKCQVKALTIRIVGPAVPPDDAFVQIPFVWKSQLDLLDAEFIDTKGSAVERFYLASDTAEGLWQVWPFPVTDLTPAPP